MFMFKYGAIFDRDNLFLTTSDNFSNVKYYKRVTEWIGKGTKNKVLYLKAFYQFNQWY